MGELSLVKKGKLDAEGLYIAQSEYTCWQYGINHINWTYSNPSMTWVTNNTSEVILVGSATDTVEVYLNIALVDGELILSNLSNVSVYSASGYYPFIGGYMFPGNAIVHLDGYSGIDDYGNKKISFDSYLPANPPAIGYLGHIYSKNSNKYPADGIGDNGYYYLKKTSTTFNKAYW
jgi:hypothetical protein